MLELFELRVNLESHQITAKKKISATSRSTPIKPPKIPAKLGKQISLSKDDDVVKSGADDVDVDVQETVNDGKKCLKHRKR